MPKPRLEINENLPSRWVFRHGAYFYKVPAGHEPCWEHKQMYRLGVTFDEAVKTFSEVGSKTSHADDIPAGSLLNHAEIVAAAKPFAQGGVYFLIDKGIVIYVGRSKNVAARIGLHLSRGIIGFDAVHWVSADGWRQERLEQLYIATLAPRYNIRFKGDPDKL